MKKSSTQNIWFIKIKISESIQGGGGALSTPPPPYGRVTNIILNFLTALLNLEKKQTYNKL